MEYILTEHVQEKAAQVAELMNERLRVRGKDLAAKLRRTGRLMPKRIKRNAAFLAETAALAQNPKLQQMINHEKVDAAHKSCVEFLETIDLADRRKGVFLGILGSLVLTVLVVILMVGFVLVWRGYL